MKKYVRITSPKELQKAIRMAINGNDHVIMHIGTYILYNFYYNTHIKADSPEDIENEYIYSNFKFCYPELFAEVEKWITNKVKWLNSDGPDFD